jgi:hypothetical protein
LGIFELFDLLAIRYCIPSLINIILYLVRFRERDAGRLLNVDSFDRKSAIATGVRIDRLTIYLALHYLRIRHVRQQAKNQHHPFHTIPRLLFFIQGIMAERILPIFLTRLKRTRPTERFPMLERLFPVENGYKGEKTQIVPATNELMIELARYRREKGLSPFPTHAEDIRLLQPIGTQQRQMTRGAVHALVKQVFLGSVERLRSRGDSYISLAFRTEEASAHW